MSSDILSHPRVEGWRMEYPQEWWAFSQLEEKDEIRERVLAAVLAGRFDDPVFLDLTRYREALENYLQATQKNLLDPPPSMGERRAIEVLITRMVKIKKDSVVFRVDFSTKHGWSGYFDTQSPNVVERIAKHRLRSRPLTVVGEITARPYTFLVVLDNRVQIV